MNPVHVDRRVLTVIVGSRDHLKWLGTVNFKKVGRSEFITFKFIYQMPPAQQQAIQEAYAGQLQHAMAAF